MAAVDDSCPGSALEHYPRTPPRESTYYTLAGTLTVAVLLGAEGFAAVRSEHGAEYTALPH